MIKLNDYINQEHGGCKAAFAREFGYLAQNVNRMIKAEFYIVECDSGKYLVQLRKSLTA